MRFFREIWLTDRFFFGAGAVAALFVAGLLHPLFVWAGWVGFAGFLAAAGFDLRLLYSRNPAVASRRMNSRFSNGDENPVQITVHNPYGFPVRLRIIDEIPVGFQVRDMQLRADVGAGEKHRLEYLLRPVRRGVYAFGDTHVFYQTPVGLTERRITRKVTPGEHQVQVYPAYLELQRYELQAIAEAYSTTGTRLMRTEALSLEFDQIRDYTTGDDPRAVNWAATARRNKLMVNQYTEERAQAIYSVIDTGRVMKMPFGGMTLLDYAINATLAVSKIALSKHDKPGLLTWSSGVEQFVKADVRKAQLHYLNETLYHLKTGFHESNLESLYVGVRRFIPSRSTLLLYTNIETLHALSRVMGTLQQLGRRHLLIVILFENIEVSAFRSGRSESLDALYDKAVAEDRILEKERIVLSLRKAGIRTLLTPPEELTTSAINRYLMLKKSGLS
jgi:uncharacterized protein (DUF58 family)